MKVERTVGKLLLVTALSMFIVAAGAVEGMSDSSSPDRWNEVQVVTGATSGSAEIAVWDGGVVGQAGAPVNTDFVKGVLQVNGSRDICAWNGCVVGQAGAPLETDLAVLPVATSGEKGSWNGYLSGSLSIWQQNL